MGSPVELLVAALRERGETLGTAESLTGGRVAAVITGVAGASQVYAGGVVSYQTPVKVSVLGVSDQIVAAHGVVSVECAQAMAEGVRRLLGTTYGVSTTGVAGPDPLDGKPVGTVHVGVAGPDGTRVETLALAGSRTDIQNASVEAAVSAVAAMIGSAGQPLRDVGGFAAEDSTLG